MSYGKIFPYAGIMIDARWKDFFKAARECFYSSEERMTLLEKLKALWTSTDNGNHVLPCLSVRTALDMYLRIMDFPEDSEVIMSAINIPDMCYIVRSYKLKIVSLDINIDDTSPKVELFETLVTPRTKLVIVAHIYGKWFDLNPLLDLAEKRGIPVLEDCAEGFHGLSHIGNPRCDLSLFSFGGIKYATSFGGAIAKVKDEVLYNEMLRMQQGYPFQSHREYLKKVVRYGMVRVLVNVPSVTRMTYGLARDLKFDIQKFVVTMVRGFPNDLLRRLRQQPCTALLATMLHRHSTFNGADNLLAVVKGEYMAQRLPENATSVGLNAPINNYWLCPILVDEPDEVVRLLQGMGVYAYRGATQLNLVEPDITPDTRNAVHATHSAPDSTCHIDTALRETVMYPITQNRNMSHTTGDVSQTNAALATNDRVYADRNSQYQAVPGVFAHRSDASFSSPPGSATQTFDAKQSGSGSGSSEQDAGGEGPLTTPTSVRISTVHQDLDHRASVNSEQKRRHTAAGNPVTEDVQNENCQFEHLDRSFQTFPHEAKYLMDHVVYLPVNKTVPFTELDHVAECVTSAVEKSLLGKRAPSVGYRPKLKSNL